MLLNIDRKLSIENDEISHLRRTHLHWLLLRLARIYRREVNRALAEHGLSDAKALPVLHIARAGGGLRQGVLAEELGVEGPSLVRILDQLCAGQSGRAPR
jgi:hypothetical protein